MFARVTRVLNHLAAGTLTIDQLRIGIERTWEEFSARDSDIAAGLMRWEEEMLARFVTRDDDVLLVGSGPGRDLVAMVAGGYRVTALEPARLRDRDLPAPAGDARLDAPRSSKASSRTCRCRAASTSSSSRAAATTSCPNRGAGLRRSARRRRT